MRAAKGVVFDVVGDVVRVVLDAVASASRVVFSTFGIHQPCRVRHLSCGAITSLRTLTCLHRVLFVTECWSRRRAALVQSSDSHRLRRSTQLAGECHACPVGALCTALSRPRTRSALPYLWLQAQVAFASSACSLTRQLAIASVAIIQQGRVLCHGQALCDEQ